MRTFSVALLIILALAVIVPTQIHGTNTGSQPVSNGTLSIVKLKTNATGLSACILNVSTPTGAIVKTVGTLFGNIRIIFNMTWTNSNQTYGVALGSFNLLVTQKNIVVSNSTNFSQDEFPTNTVTNVVMFPNIPVILILSFGPVCVTPGALARIIYLDGNFNFVFNLP